MTSPAKIGSFLRWIAGTGWAEDSWLILGKGPSFSELGHYDVSGYRSLSLNHVVREQTVDVAHIVDYNVVTACGDLLLSHCKVLVMPWHPHDPDARYVKKTPASSRNLDSFANTDPVLRQLRAEGRLLTYNLITGRLFESFENDPVIPLFFFGFEAAFNLLAEAGVKKIRSLGVDGGGTYSTRFTDLRDKTLLINGVDSFDRQFHPIAITRYTKGIDFCPLNDESPMKVFVAGSKSEWLPTKVLEYSVLRNASRNVSVVPIIDAGIKIPEYSAAASLAATPFSFQRFLIPEICHYQGRAIYLDSDMVVFKDIRQLWQTALEGEQILTVEYQPISHRRPQFSVMLLDCGSLDWDIRKILSDLDRGAYSYKQLMTDMVVASRIRAGLPSHWNHLEHYIPRRTGLLHYTDQHSQPWISIKNTLGWVWVRELFSAVDSGHLSRSSIEAEVAQGHVRPTLLWQLDAREENPLLIPRRKLELDRNFSPPYVGVGAHVGAPHHYRRSRRDELNSVKARTERIKIRLKRRVNDLLGRPPPSPYH